MNRDLVKFMKTENDLNRERSFKPNEINLKNTAIYNIRKNDNGLYFDLKINGVDAKNITDLFIPAKFYQQTISETQSRGMLVINKAKLAEYFLIYPAAIGSLVLIISTFFRYLPTIRNLFNLTGL